MSSAKAGPPLRWAGGKSRLIPQLVELLPDGLDSMRYVAPFVGGGALFFHLAPERALLADACGPLVVLWQTLADPDGPETVGRGTRGLVAQLQHLERKRGRDGLAIWYQARRDEINLHLTGIEPLQPRYLAALMVALSRSCFNGLWRVNAYGHFNVSPDPSKAGCDLAQVERFEAVHAMLRARAVEVQQADFRVTLSQAGAGDFVFADSPYVPSVVEGAGLFGPARAPSFTGYTAEGWSTRDTVELFAFLAAARDRGAHVMATNHDAPEVRSLAAEHSLEVHAVEVLRSVSCKASTRGATGEVVITGAPR